MNLRNTKYKYLKTEDFIELCRTMRVYLGRKPEDLLEVYEQHGLVKPVYRLYILEDYIKTLFKYQHASKSEKPNISLPEEYAEIHNFIQDRLQNYHATYPPWIDRTLSEGHPLDWAYKEGKPYVEKPPSGSFKPWTAYTVIAGELYGYSQYSTIAEHYYAQWQVFLVEEANRLFSVMINRLLPSRSSAIGLEKSTLTLLEWINEFEVLAEYRFKKQLLFEKYINQTSDNILEGALLEEYHKKVTEQASTIFIQIPEERWIEFLRKLCNTYFLYEEKEKIKLSKFLKSHIYSTVEIYIEATKLPYSQLVNKVGNIIGRKEYFYRLPLEKILPDEEKEKKREAEYHLRSFKDKYNSIMSGQIINDSVICEIIEEVIKQGNDTLLTTIIEIEKEWWEDSIFWYGKIWSHIRSLATAVETFGRHVFPTKTDLYNCINESLKGQYESLKQPFDNYFKRRVIEANNPSEFLEKLDIIINTPDSIRIPNDLINLKFLLIANLIRNFVNHSSKIDGKLFGSRFLVIYQSLIFSFFYLFKNK